GLFEDRRIRTNEEACFLGGLDAFDGLLEYSFALDAHVMRFFEPVEVHIEKEPRRRFEFVQPLFDEHPVSAEIDMFPATQDFADKTAQFRIDHGLASAN